MGYSDRSAPIYSGEMRDSLGPHRSRKNAPGLQSWKDEVTSLGFSIETVCEFVKYGYGVFWIHREDEEHEFLWAVEGNVSVLMGSRPKVSRGSEGVVSDLRCN